MSAKKLTLFSFILLLIFSFASLAGCGSEGSSAPEGGQVVDVSLSPVATIASSATSNNSVDVPRSNKGKLVDIYPNLANLAIIGNPIINYSWDGLYIIAPISVMYILGRKSQAFDVEATYNMTFNLSMLKNKPAGSPPTKKVAEKKTLTIPTSDVNEFLQKLMSTPVEAGPYRGTPLPEHTDDYPSLQFSLATPKGVLSFFSKSQTANFFPWTVSYAGNIYTATDATPFEAFSRLDDAYLKMKETFNQISDKELAIPLTP